MANNGLYATGVGSKITANNGDVYINTYAKNFLELLGENASYTEGSAKSDAVSGKRGGQVTLNETGRHKVNILGNLDLGSQFGVGSRITAVLNGSDFIEVVSSSTGGTHYIEALNVNKLADLSEDIWVADAPNNISFKAYDNIDINNEYVYDYKPILRSHIKDGDPASQ